MRARSLASTHSSGIRVPSSIYDEHRTRAHRRQQRNAMKVAADRAACAQVGACGWLGGWAVRAAAVFFKSMRKLWQSTPTSTSTPEHEPSFVLPTYFLFNRIVEVLKEF